MAYSRFFSVLGLATGTAFAFAIAPQSYAQDRPTEDERRAAERFAADQHDFCQDQGSTSAFCRMADQCRQISDSELERCVKWYYDNNSEIPRPPPPRSLSTCAQEYRITFAPGKANLDAEDYAALGTAADCATADGYDSMTLVTDGSGLSDQRAGAVMRALGGDFGISTSAIQHTPQGGSPVGPNEVVVRLSR